MEQHTFFTSKAKHPPALMKLIQTSFTNFFQQDYATFIKTIQTCIPESLLLQGKANTTAEGIHTQTDKENFYGLTEVEEIRAFSGLLRFKDVVCGRQEDYDQFVACQIEFKKPVLSFASFKNIQAYVQSILKSPADYAAAIWSILCNDLGKLHSLIEIYEQLPNNNSTNHDLLLAELLIAKPQLFPGFQALPLNQQQLIIAGYGSGCDISQFEQLELPTIALSGLKSLSKEALDLYILHTIFDVAGAAAHVKSNGSLTMHEETWKFFNVTRQCLEKLPTHSIEEVYANYLAYRGQCIGLEHSSPEATALIRIAGMARLATQEQGQLLLAVWQNLAHDIQEILMRELNIHGGQGTPAIFVSYSVAMLLNPQAALQKQLQEKAKQQGLEVTAQEKRQATMQGLSIGLITLAKILNAVRENLKPNLDDKIISVECDEIARSLSQDPPKTLDMTIELVPLTDLSFRINLIENKLAHAMQLQF